MRDIRPNEEFPVTHGGVEFLGRPEPTQVLRHYGGEFGWTEQTLNAVDEADHMAIVYIWDFLPEPQGARGGGES